MKKSRCLLLDANVVIGLFELGLWESVVSRCELTLSEVVVNEADYYSDATGVERGIDLRPDIESGRIHVISVNVAEAAAFRARFDDLYVQKLDDGETESLIFCEREGEPYRLCSSDAMVFKALAVLDRGEQGVSLEELLAEIGLPRTLAWKFTKGFREEYHRKGIVDRFGGIGLRPK